MQIFLYKYNSTAVYKKNRNIFISKINELLKIIKIEKNNIKLKLILFLNYNIGRLLIKQVLINIYNNPKYILIKNIIIKLIFFTILYNGKD